MTQHYLSIVDIQVHHHRRYSCCNVRVSPHYPHHCRHVIDAVAKDWAQTPPCCQQRMREMLFYITSLLEKHKIVHYVYAGVLIGALRCGGYNPFDYDMDVGYEWDQTAAVRYATNMFSKCVLLSL
jgi:hypothetical protein